MYQAYKCADCGSEFSTPDYKTIIEHHSELAGELGPKDEVFTEELCPDCGSVNIDGGSWCECCGDRWANGVYMDICEDCIEVADKHIENFQKELKVDYKTAIGVFVELCERKW